MYCTIDDIKGVMSETDLIQLTDDNIPPLQIVQTNVDAAIARADELLNGYLRGRYVLPLNPIPGIMRDLAVDVAVYNLYKRKRKGKFPETIADDYKNTLKILDNIQRSIIDIGSVKTGAVDAGAPVATSGGSAVGASERLFTRDKMRGY